MGITTCPHCGTRNTSRYDYSGKTHIRCKDIACLRYYKNPYYRERRKDRSMYKPIIFCTEMVQAILEGRKTVTRRVLRPQPHPDLRERTKNEKHPKLMTHFETYNPKYKVGNILWVRETSGMYFKAVGEGEAYKVKGHIRYKADAETCAENCNSVMRWIPSIHMPKEAARLFLKVTDVRVERLQDITNKQIRSEGACEFGCVTHRLAFQDLWDGINAKRGYGWDTNPWVWVIEFDRTEKPEGWPN